MSRKPYWMIILCQKIWKVQENNLFGPKFEEHLHKKKKLTTESKKLFSKVTYNKHGNNKGFSSGPQQMPVVGGGGGDSSYSSGVHPATLPQEKVATRKVRIY